MKNIDLSQVNGHALRVFLEVYEGGSVSRAADVFDLTQSTVSHTIDRLRTALGDPLFVKSGRGITPTEKAIAIAPRVKEILAALEGLVASETYDAARETAPFVIAVPTPALVGLMKRVQTELGAAAPNAAFHVRRLAPRERLEPMLTQGEADVAVAISQGGYSASLKAESLGGDDLVIFYDPDVRDPIRTFADYAAALHGVTGFGGSTKSVVAAALETLGVERKIAFVAPTASTLGEFIKGTDIIATMPLKLAEYAYRDLAHCEPPLPLPRLRYDLVWHRRFDHSGRNGWLRRIICDAAKAEHAAAPEEVSAPDAAP
ncbi:MAG: LysR family transcriptional regulator [Pseudomonadota bacterium]